MNKRYMLRGIGIGLVVAAGIMLGAAPSMKQDNDSSKKTVAEATTEATTKDNTSTDKKEEKTTEAPTTQAPTTEAPATEAPSTEAPTEASSEISTDTPPTP